MRAVLLFFVSALPLFSQAERTIFPTDSRPFSQTEDKDLIETVCPGHREKAGKVDCGKNCPSSSGLDGGQHFFDWSLVRVAYGHFLSPASDGAVVSTAGCEPHSNNWGGSVLLTRRADKWRMMWYEPGVQTEQCHRIRLTNGREILICLGEYGGQGNIWRQLYLEDLLHPKVNLMASHSIFEVFDNTAPCASYDETARLTHALIDRIEFIAKDTGVPAMFVEFSVGKRTMTPAEREECNAATPAHRSSFMPAMRHQRLVFVFDGHDYKPTPSSAALAKRLELQ